MTRRTHQPSGLTPRASAESIRSHARRLITGLLGAVLALSSGLGSGAAFAFWTTTGSGIGTASTATPQAVTLIAASGTVGSTLIPGGMGELLVQLHNPNSYPVTITGIAQQENKPAVGPGGTCQVTAVTVPTRTGLSIRVNSGENVQVRVTDGAAMAAESDSGCQGASFQIPVIVSVRS